jgi:hypothetical protein
MSRDLSGMGSLSISPVLGYFFLSLSSNQFNVDFEHSRAELRGATR